MSRNVVVMVIIMVLGVFKNSQCQLVTTTSASGIITCAGQLIGSKSVTATNHDTVQITLLMSQAVPSGSSCLLLNATPSIVIGKGLSYDIATISLDPTCGTGTHNASFQIPFCEGPVSSCSNQKYFTISASGEIRPTVMITSDADPGKSFGNVLIGVSDTIQVTLSASGNSSASVSVSTVVPSGDTSIIKPVGVGLAVLKGTFTGGMNKVVSFYAKPTSVGKKSATFDLQFYPCNGVVSTYHSNIFLDVTGVPPYSSVLPSATTVLEPSFGLKRGIITYTLDRQSPVEIRIYNILGKKIFEFNSQQLPGSHSISIKRLVSSSEQYIVDFKAGIIEKKIIVMRDL